MAAAGGQSFDHGLDLDGGWSLGEKRKCTVYTISNDGSDVFLGSNDLD